MTWSLRKFPRTPHFPGSSGALVKTERALAAAESDRLLHEPVLVEEKLDGANLGISFDEQGSPILQSRGSLIEPGRTAPQFAPLYAWLAPHQEPLYEALGSGKTLFGEWLYARHSITYDALPDFFLAFDVLDRESGLFLTVAERTAICEAAGIAVAPLLFSGVLGTEAKLRGLLLRSRFGPERAEGLYVRLEEGGKLVLRAKLVREGWAPADERHWSQRPLERNRLKLGAPQPVVGSVQVPA
jgi:ATP-dependent RNA circularization protein (DNA/RNA ligase family)